MKKKLLLVATFLAIIAESYCQFYQQSSKLVGTNSSEVSRQGQSVSISADGNTMVVGAPGNINQIGGAYVYTKTNGQWVQMGSRLVGLGYVSTGGSQGNSVSISGDGNTIAIGSPSENTNLGSVWIFVRNNGNWIQQAKLLGTGYDYRPHFGNSVTLSYDGNTLVAGGWGDGLNGLHEGYRGSVWVFNRNTLGTWQQDGGKIFPLNAIGGINIYFGYSVSLCNDGNIFVVGGFGDNNLVGAIWVYEKIGGIWTMNTKLVGSGYILSNNVSQGKSVSINGAGDYIAVGGPGDEGGVGAIWFFKKNSGVWQQDGLKYRNNITPFQGTQISINNDGTLLAVATEQYPTGSYYFLQKNNSNWTQLGNIITVTGSVNATGYGMTIALCKNGNSAIIGTPTENATEGAVWYLLNNNIVPTLLNKFKATQNDKCTELLWQSSTETNISAYNIQSSTDGINYNTIGVVKPNTQNNSSSSNEYIFYDYEKYNSSKVYYRLQIIDKDRAYSYSCIIKLVIPFTKMSFSIFPNPVKQKLEVQVLCNKTEESAVILIKDILGRIVNQKQVNLHIGQNNFIFNLDKISKGVYFIVLENNNTIVKQFVKE